jgi:hypothetical protein
MARIVWGLFGSVHRIVESAARYADAGTRTAHQMWEASPVSAAILAAGGLLAVVLVIFLTRLIIKLVRRVLRGLAWAAALPGGPVGRFRRLRRIRRRLRYVPVAAVAEFVVVARKRDVPGATWLASHAPSGTLFDDHLRAVSALLILQARLPEQSRLKGEAIILRQLYSHLPVLVEYLVSQMSDLAEIQRVTGGHSLNNHEMHYPALIDEARRTRCQLEEIARTMPVLVDHALVQPHRENMSRMTLDLESLHNTIRQILDIGWK